MRIVVIGYGRVGFRTVSALLERGHQISLVDKEASRLSRASHLEGVDLVHGNGIDVDIQREAGVGERDMLLALPFDANVTLLRAQVPRPPYGAPIAIPRVYEPTHAKPIQEDPQLIAVCPTLFAFKHIEEQVEIAPGQSRFEPRTPVEPPPRH